MYGPSILDLQHSCNAHIVFPNANYKIKFLMLAGLTKGKKKYLSTKPGTRLKLCCSEQHITLLVHHQKLLIKSDKLFYSG
jgi:hypothetical protein